MGATTSVARGAPALSTQPPPPPDEATSAPVSPIRACRCVALGLRVGEGM